MSACSTPGQGLQNTSQSQSSVESWLSSGGEQGLVENHCSLSPTHPAQALCCHMRMEGAAWGAPTKPHTEQTRAVAVGSHCSSAKQMVGAGFWSFSLPDPCSVCTALTSVWVQLSHSA